MRVLLLGLDSAGKTTILFHLIGRREQTVPTIGFNVETVRFNGLEFVVWDVSGQERLRPFWRHYYRGTSGVVFVVDSADVERLTMARAELFGILNEEELANAVVLVFSNKTDLPNAVTPEQLADALQLERLRPRPYHVQRSNASIGEGISEGLDWLAEEMRKARRLAAENADGSAFGIRAAPHRHANGRSAPPPSSTLVPTEYSQANTEAPAPAKPPIQANGIATPPQMQPQSIPIPSASADKIVAASSGGADASVRAIGDA